MQQGKSGCGCFAGGCAAVLIVLGVILIILFAVGYSFYKKALDYTGVDPIPIATHEVDAEEFKQLSARVADFKTSYDAKQPASLALTADDINTFISMSPKLKEMKGKLHVRIENGLIHLDGSIPLTEVVGFRDRYLNGSMAFEASVTDGKVRVIPQKIVLNGKTLPKDLEKELKQGFEEGFQEELEKDPKTREVLRRIQSVAVDGDRLLIFTGSPGSVPAPVPAAPQPVEKKASLEPRPAKLFVCPKDIAAYDSASPPVQVGYFLTGTELEILGPSTIPGMTTVRYREEKGTATTMLCKTEDLTTK